MNDEKEPHKTPGRRIVKTMNARQRSELEIKMKNAYGVAKMGRPFTDYNYLCTLDESKGIKPGTVYRNTAACTQFIQCIADSIRNDTQKLISNTKFMSLTMDGSTDVSGEEQESFYIRLSLAGRVYQRYLSVATPETTTAQGIFDLLMIQLKTQGVDLKKLIGFGSDGAATMMGSRSGVAIRLKEICVVALMLIYFPCVFIMINMVIQVHYGSVIVFLCIIWYLL